MMHHLTLLILSLALLCSSAGQSQLEASIDKVDFGEISKGDDRVIEFSILNAGDKKVDLLRVDAGSMEYDVRTEFKSIEAGESMLLRVKINPTRTGTRKDELQLLFNSETLTLALRADIEYVDRTNNTPCPDFDRPAHAAAADWEVYFKVIDKDTQEPVSGAKITLEGKAGSSQVLTVNRRGEVIAQLPIDYYMMQVRETGYSSFSLDTYINKRNKDFLIELRPGVGGVAIYRPGRDRDPEPSKPEPVEEDEEIVIRIPEPVTPSPASEAVDTPSDFSLAEYKANNVVFLIDVSTSMRQQERIEILKRNMEALADMLRPEDVISIVTYASTTDVLISGVRASERERIAEAIASLEAEGNTAGEAGLKKAYQICARHAIEGGNNQIYLATDGAFNASVSRLGKLVERNAKDGRYLSVLAIRSSKWADSKMKVLAEQGEGNHLSVKEDSETDALQGLIRSQSKR